MVRTEVSATETWLSTTSAEHSHISSYFMRLYLENTTIISRRRSNSNINKTCKRIPCCIFHSKFIISRRQCLNWNFECIVTIIHARTILTTTTTPKTYIIKSKVITLSVSTMSIECHKETIGHSHEISIRTHSLSICWGIVHVTTTTALVFTCPSTESIE